MRILKLREVARMTVRITLEFALEFIYVFCLNKCPLPDALAICRVHGNPSFFITFTCNVKWPEISEYMEDFPGLTTTDKADVILLAVLYKVKFQRRGLAHCHTSIRIDETKGAHSGALMKIFWKITILKTDTPYPSRRFSVSVPAFTKDHKRNEDQYAVSRETQYTVFKI
ncbi:DNA helicase [Tanacetum coccineum]